MNTLMESELFGEHITRKFIDIFPDFESFQNDYYSTPLSASDMKQLEILYNLLLANYANSSIINTDESQFKLRLWTIVFMYGPTWEKRLEVQKIVRGLSESDILAGSKAIYNHAFNDGSKPTTATLEEIDYINEQNTTNYKRSKLDAYAQLLALIETDVTRRFIDEFRPLFIKFVAPQKPLIYVSEQEEEDLYEY